MESPPIPVQANSERPASSETNTEFEVSYKDTKTGETRSTLVAKPFVIAGRSLRSHVVLHDDEISYRHALFVAIDDTIFCVDLSNRNGVRWSDGKRSSGWVTPEDVLSLGPFEISVRLKSCSRDMQLPVEGNPLEDRIAVNHRQKFRPHLEWMKDGDVKESIHLSHILTFAGSCHRCRLRFVSPDVSGMHCAFLRDDERLFVIDLLGNKGTLVNDRKIKYRELQHGDIVSIGKYRLRVDTTSVDQILFDSLMESPANTLKETREFWIRKIQQNTLLPESLLSQVLKKLQPASFHEFAKELASRNHLTQWQQEKLTSPDNYKLVLQKRYYLREKIARGGTSSIYRAFDGRLKRDVAVKVPRGKSHLYPKLLKRLQREATAIARIHHPNIVAVLDISPKGTYIVMELIEGENMKEMVMKLGSLSSSLTVHYTVQLLDAVATLHRTGIVHRDIKPSNILVLPDSQIKLLDMGLARFNGEGTQEQDDETEPLTRVGTLLGTVCYMAPEQAVHGTNADERSDIYSIGCTLYELLSGRPPFHSENRLEILKKHADEPVEPIENIDKQLAEIVEKSLEKLPEKRYQTADEFAQSLKQWQRDRSQTAAGL